MNIDTIVFIIVVVVFLFGGLIKRMLEALQEQARVERGPEPDWEASPEQIREFLQSLEGEEQPEAPAPERAAVQAPRPRAAQPAEEVSFRPPSAPRGRARPERPPARRRRRAEAPPTPAKAEPPHPPAITAEDPREFDLRKAVVWAEILGRPVSLRRDRRTAR
jgi:hypothetical protein